ncbi:MAG: hypothetical protein IJM07_06220 [Pyramidobacter sp.]|nr:hypothetical protein [Pyramidobacter sp.]
MKNKGKLLLCMLQVEACAVCLIWAWLAFNDLRAACAGSDTALFRALLRDGVFISCLALALILALIARFSLRGLTAALKAEGKELRDKPERRVVLASLTVVLAFVLLFLLLGARTPFHPMLLLALFAAADLGAAALLYRRLVSGGSGTA